MTHPRTRAIGLGCMRLSTATDRDDDRSIGVIHAALDSGATLLDTADVYGRDEQDIGHNERLIARALGSWSGDRTQIEVATKGGLRRAGKDWTNDGRGKHLKAACEASRVALATDVIDLYQLHAVDPRTPLETSMRALAALQTEGLIRRIGLCNVTVGQIAAAREIADIAAVQVSLSVFDSENLRNGVAEYCHDHGIRLLAYRPLGGTRVNRLAKDPVLQAIANRRGRTPAEIALAWLLSFEGVEPLPGATQLATARSIRAALDAQLDADDCAALDARFHGRLLRVPRVRRRPPDESTGEVVIVMGIPGAGKTSATRELEAQGYARLNRDERGGTLADLVPLLRAGLAEGRRRWVLDNSYASRAARSDVIECAWSFGVPVRCVWLTTSLADAQINAISRLIDAHGELPAPDVLRERGREDPRYFGPDAQFRFERALEPPAPDEGFASITLRPFARQSWGQGRMLILDLDDLVDASSGTGQLELRPGRREVLVRYHDDGWLLFAYAWRPDGRGSETAPGLTPETSEALGAPLGAAITIASCIHPAGPPVCWCRKPLPGRMIEFAMRHRVSLPDSLVVARSAADRTLAEKLGAPVVDASTFFTT